jgi:hypothetical protein
LKYAIARAESASVLLPDQKSEKPLQARQSSLAIFPAHAGEDGKDIRITIRRMIDGDEDD